MPWREVETVDLRRQLVDAYRAGGVTMTDLAAAYGVSRKTAYKWVARYDEAGMPGLADRDRRPHGHPATTSRAVEDALVEAHRRFPRWSPGKLQQWLSKQPGGLRLSRSTAYVVLRRAGVVLAEAPPRRLVPRPPIRSPLPAATAANDLWTTDFKGHFPTGDRQRCYPLTLRDGFSRFVLCCTALSSESMAATRRCFERAFHEFGLPGRLRMDNGRPFASPGVGRLTQLSVWWLRLGIQLERIRPGHPEQNGSHEQFHRVLKRDTARPPAPTRRAQQRRFDAFCREYNEERPHDALQGDVPATHYRPSRRRLPRRLPPLEYAGHHEVRRVATNGTVSWANRPLFLSEALRGEAVAFEEVDDDLWLVWFGTVQLARFNARQWRWC